MGAKDIKALRQLMGLPQHEFARLIGVAELTVNKWERGHVQPKRESIQRIESLVGTKNLQVIQSTLIHNMPLLEVAEDIQKRIQAKKRES
ncbi:MULTISPECIES: helix-turn-helix domain-containing protein [Bacillus]|uniref:Transcriptional regulator n=1 Tax=Bacillus bombysepticus str. Wang TaxID=1330043 RepID=A0A9W3KUQ1_9BACI|nr:helix-turn-helix transcriptional regulator [Bacillus bombysepticus]AHX20192.1 transcriptional regulator [Bacillus bombysepticus str. Wang]